MSDPKKNRIVAGQLEAFRTEKGWTVKDLATVMGISETCCGEYLRGKRRPNAEALDHIIDKMNDYEAFVIATGRKPKIAFVAR
jgi:transcriptional regulator with XRE-family HTH domain